MRRRIAVAVDHRAEMGRLGTREVWIRRTIAERVVPENDEPRKVDRNECAERDESVRRMAAPGKPGKVIDASSARRPSTRSWPTSATMMKLSCGITAGRPGLLRRCARDRSCVNRELAMATGGFEVRVPPQVCAAPQNAGIGVQAFGEPRHQHVEISDAAAGRLVEDVIRGFDRALSAFQGGCRVKPDPNRGALNWAPPMRL